MSRATMPILLALSLVFAGHAVQKGGTSQGGGSRTVMTGCVDEDNGIYVLADDRSLQKIAELRAVGFDPEGFAKFLGNKVRVQGEKSSSTPTPVLKVRSIEKIADACAPAEDVQKRNPKP
jgi:hypothetical protein